MGQSGSTKYAGFGTVEKFALSDCHVLIEVADVLDADVAGSAWFEALAAPNQPTARFVAELGDIRAGRYTHPGTEVDVSAPVPYDAVAHRWWRLREAAGTTYFEVAPSGAGPWAVLKAIDSEPFLASVELGFRRAPTRTTPTRTGRPRGSTT